MQDEVGERGSHPASFRTGCVLSVLGRALRGWVQARAPRWRTCPTGGPSPTQSPWHTAPPASAFPPLWVVRRPSPLSPPSPPAAATTLTAAGSTAGSSRTPPSPPFARVRWHPRHYPFLAAASPCRRACHHRRCCGWDAGCGWVGCCGHVGSQRMMGNKRCCPLQAGGGYPLRAGGWCVL